MNENRRVFLIVDSNRFGSCMEYDVFLYICGVKWTRMDICTLLEVLNKKMK